MSLLKVGIAEPLGGGSVPVQRVLARNASMMTGPGTNSYVLGARRLAVVDPGPADPVHIQTLLEILDGRPLDWIFVTHTHADHAPGTALLQARTGAQVVGLPAPAAMGNASQLEPSFAPARRYHDGEVIDCCEFRMHLLHTPGHASNHLCFLLEEEGMLFTGDHILEGTTPVILPPDGNMGHYLDSLRRLQSLSLRSLAPGHGRLLEEPQTVIDTLLRHRLRREAKALRTLQTLSHLAERVTLEELTPQVYDDVSAHLWPWAQRTLLAHLLKLEEDGRVARADEHWSIAPGSATQDATNHDS